MVNKFGDHGGRYFHPIKKVLHTQGTFRDYIDNIIETYRIGLTPYRETGTITVPVFAYVNSVYIHGGYGVQHPIPSSLPIHLVCGM